MPDSLNKGKNSASPQEEVEIQLEEALGHPLSGNPAQRIKALRKRVTYLEDQRLRSEQVDEPLRTALLKRTDADLAEAKQQLREWQTQFEGRN